VRRFPLVGFKRVFDVDVVQQCVSLEQLVEGLLRFELRPASRAREQRERGLVEGAWAALREGRYQGGAHYSQLLKVQHEAARRGEDPKPLVEAAYERLLRGAADKSKKDLRLWSPALYGAVRRRGSENVLAMSCLVLDYDDGSSAQRVHETWSDWLYVLHSTWSHREEYPKLRICLPLAGMVGAADWKPLWAWARERTGGAIDPAPSSPGSTFALPAVSTPQGPRRARLNNGPLLDPVARGLAPPCPLACPEPHLEPDSHFLPDPSRRYLQDPHPDLDTQDWDLEAAFDELF
jgi:hypothetical protein